MTLHFLPQARDPYESVIEDVIATRNGDLRAALRLGLQRMNSLNVILRGHWDCRR